MNEIAQNLIVLVAIIVIGGVIFFGIKYKQGRNEDKIVGLARENGWSLETVRLPLAWGQHIVAPRWRLEAMSISSGVETGPGSSNIAASTRWYSDLPGGPLLLGPRRSSADLGAVGDILMQAVLRSALGNGADGVREFPCNNPSFDQAYRTLARHAAAAENFLTPQVQKLLIEWRGEKPVIKYTPQGLSIEIAGVHMKKDTEILQVIRAGELLLDNLAGEVSQKVVLQ